MRVPVFCGKDCGGGACPMLAEIEGGRLTRILPNPASGKWILPCERGFRLAEEHYSPLRLRSPLVRRRRLGGPAGLEDYREAGWDEALTIVADRLGEIQTRFGADSVLALAGAGSVGALHSSSDLAERFLSLRGGYTRLSGSYSNGAARVVLPYLLGPEWRTSGFDPATMRHAEMIVLWGANVLEARLGSEIPARLLEAKARGARIVAIDPRRSKTVKRAATWHIPCRPGTDSALMLSLLEALAEEGLAKREWAIERSVGYEALEDYVLGRKDGIRRDPEWAEPITGVAAEETRRLARAWAAANPVMLLPGYSIQRLRGGEEPYRLSLALQLATGNFGRLGGSTGSLNNRLPTPRVGSIDALDKEDRPSVPVLLWPDAILGGKASGLPRDIHAALVAGGNWLGQGADARKSARALDALDFSFCLELFPTPTALRSDVILPVASPLEKEDIGLPWLGNWLSYKPRLFAPAALARSDYEIYADLAERMGFGEAYTEGRDEAAWIRSFLADSDIADTEAFRREGFWLAPDQERVGLEGFARDPAARPLGTPSGRVELESEAWAREMGGTALPQWSPAGLPAPGEFLLVTPKVGHRTHSQGGDPESVERTGGHYLSIQPLDAAEIGLAEGDRVRIEAEGGASAMAGLRFDAGLMRGVLSLPEGIWLPIDSNNYDESSSPNLLSSTLDHGPAAAASMHGLRVRIIAAPEGTRP